MHPVALLVALAIAVEAPPSLEAAAARIRAVDRQALAAALGAAGLAMPAEVRVTLVAENDPVARRVPRWLAGQAFGRRHVVIFAERVTRYPYDSLESVLRHEVVHLSLSEAASGRALPRWFHEGVATSVEAGWDTRDELRLVLAAITEPTVDDVADLFETRSQAETELAYLLSAALVHELRREQGAEVPGRIARRVAAGVPFATAFREETGRSPDAVAALAWRSYRRWSRWVPALASASAIWVMILALAFLAYLARRRRRARVRRRWEEEERPLRWPGQQP